MTLEEAIKMLKSKMDGSVDTSHEWTECVRLAIKALKQQPCEDCISRAEAQTEIMTYSKLISNGSGTVFIKVSDAVDVLRKLPPVTPATVWHRIKTRPLTDEEKEAYWEAYGEEYTFAYDCKMPDDEQEVLVKTQWGIEKATYHTDYGCYFENYEDEGDVIAWTELPTWEE